MSKHKNNLVPCTFCGRILYRTPYRQSRVKHVFCSHYCQNQYYFPPKPIVTHKPADYNQKAWLVSHEIAEALETGNYPKGAT